MPPYDWGVSPLISSSLLSYWGGSVDYFVFRLKGTYGFVNTAEEKLGVPVMFSQGKALGRPFAVFHLEIYDG